MTIFTNRFTTDDECVKIIKLISSDDNREKVRHIAAVTAFVNDYTVIEATKSNIDTILNRVKALKRDKGIIIIY